MQEVEEEQRELCRHRDPKAVPARAAEVKVREVLVPSKTATACVAKVEYPTGMTKVGDVEATNSDYDVKDSADADEVCNGGETGSKSFLKHGIQEGKIS